MFADASLPRQMRSVHVEELLVQLVLIIVASGFLGRPPADVRAE